MLPDRTDPLPTTARDKSGAAFVIRAYAPADRAALEAFYDRFEPKRCAQGLPPKGADRVARWLDAVLPQGHHLLVEREGEIVGHAFLVPAGTEGVAEYAIFLDRDLRGQGVGTETNRVAVEVARAAGLRRLWLSVEPHNRPATRSYQKVGFQFLPGTVYSVEAEMELELESA